MRQVLETDCPAGVRESGVADAAGSEAMTADPLRSFVNLCNGDEAAARQLFLTYEPYLRMVVRRQLPGDLRARLDSTDIVQAAWLDVLRHHRDGAWHFEDAAHLRAFLVKVTRNRFLQDLRHHQKSLKHEQPLEAMKHDELPASRCVQPGEEASASELWSRLLSLCPPAHRPILQMKRQGLSLAEIAAASGLHESSVRRILYELERKLDAACAVRHDS